LALPAIDPFNVGDFHLGSEEGSISIKFSFSNTTYTGLKRTNVTEAQFDWDKRIMRMKWFQDVSQVDGIYSIDGRFFFTSVHGSGPFKVTFNNVLTHTTVWMKPLKKDARFMNIRAQLKKETLGDMTLRFENLFNSGNSYLGETINNGMNRNKGLMESAFTKPTEIFWSRLIEERLKKFFETVPFDVLFPQHTSQI